MATKGKRVEKDKAMTMPCQEPYNHLNIPPYMWYPSVGNVQQIAYVRRLECEHEVLQSTLLTVTSQMARLQFRIRQIMIAAPSDRTKLLADLERVVFKEFYSLSQCNEELPVVEQYHQGMGDLKDRQHSLIHNLRCKIQDFKMASDCTPLQTDLDPEFEKLIAKSTSSIFPKESRSKQSKSSVSTKPSKSSLASRKTAGFERYLPDSASKSSQTDITFGKNMKRKPDNVNESH